VDDIKEFQRFLAEHASAKAARDRPGRERAAVIIAELLRRHPEWKPLAPRVPGKRGTR
jgi:hypothetical protein